MVLLIQRLAVTSAFLSGAARGLQGTAVDYFDSLRVEPSLVAESSPLSNNLHRVVDVNGTEYLLADLASFLPLSDESGIRSAIETDPVVTLLAIHHFNYPHLSPVISEGALAGCNIKLTTEIADTAYSPILSTRLLTDILQRPPLLEKPLPAGVIGAYRSAVTSPLAILTGVSVLPQVSYASTSTDFDNKDQFPYFGRTVMSSTGEARVALEYFISLKATHVGVLFVTDAFGSALQKAFQDAASDAGIITDSVAFSNSASSSGNEIANAVQALKKMQFRLFFVIAFENHYAPIMEAAYNQELIGDEYLWFIDGYDASTFHASAKFQPNSALAKATNGLALIVVNGALRPEVIYRGEASAVPLVENPTTSYEKFRTSYREAISDAAFDPYVRSKLPSSIHDVEGYTPGFVFDREPRSWSLTLYDAVTSLGLSFCRAQANATNGEFSGKDVYNQFKVLDVEGVTGQVKINENTGTRDYTTLTFSIINFQQLEELDGNGFVTYKLVTTSVYSGGSWSNVKGNQFVYANGGTTPPQSLPEPNVNNNTVGGKGRNVGYSLMGIVMVCSVVAMSWTVAFRKEPVVKASQPLFLIMVALGSLVMSSSILPLSLEEPTSLKGLDAACMAAPWLYLIGYLLAFSALFAKTRRMKQILRNPDMDVIAITASNTFGVFAVLFSLNAIMMITWTVVAPLEWSRSFTESKDLFDRYIESYGGCESSNSKPFIAVILVLNFFVLLVANFWSYQARNVETEYGESQYIGISTASVLQAWAMGVPILIVVSDNPQAKFFVSTGIIFVSSLAILSLIFVPKMYAIKKDRQRADEERKLAAFKSIRGRLGGLEFEQRDSRPEESEPLSQGDRQSSNQGNVVSESIHSPSELSQELKAELVGETTTLPSNGAAEISGVVSELAPRNTDGGIGEVEEDTSFRVSSRSSRSRNVTSSDVQHPSTPTKGRSLQPPPPHALETVGRRGSFARSVRTSMSNLFPPSPSGGIRVIRNPLTDTPAEAELLDDVSSEQAVRAQLQREREAFELIAAAMKEMEESDKQN